MQPDTMTHHATAGWSLRLHSGAVDWHGATFIEARPDSSSGELSLICETLCLQRFPRAFEYRATIRGRDRGWQMARPGVHMLMPGDRQQNLWRGLAGEVQCLRIDLPRAEEILEQPLSASSFAAWCAEPVVDPAIERLVDLLALDLTRGSPAGPLVGDSVVAALLGCLVDAPLPGARPSPSARLQRVLEHMDAHRDQRMSLPALARLAGMSPRHFSRAFRAHTASSPHRYLLMLRVDHARRLLGETDIGLAEVALRCGFSDQSQLSHTFRRFTGQTPQAFRRMAVNGPSVA